MIEINQVSKTHHNMNGSFKAINQVSLSVNQGEIFGIIGESGAGKSTLLRFINALEQPDEGEVKVAGVAINQLSVDALRNYRKEIGMIFQQFNLLNNKTVGENIHLPLELHRYESALSIEAVLEFVGLSKKKNHYPTQLSGGEKQRVGIARALITQPKILLCDEPTSALDANMRDEIMSVLAKAHQEFKTTIVIVTHELEVIKQLCHRAAVLEQGRLVDIINVDKSNRASTSQTYYQRVLEVLSDV